MFNSLHQMFFILILFWCLFGISCLFKLIIFLPKVLLERHDDLDQTLSHDDNFIWFFFCVILKSLLCLIEILRFCCQICLEVLFRFAETINFYFKHVLHWDGFVFLNAFCDEISNYLLIILSFLNLNCLLSSFILLRVLLIVLWEFLSSLICSHRSVKGVRFLVSELTLLSFGGNFWLCLKCGLIIVFKGWPRNFVLQESTSFTHSFGFAFLISFF